MAWVPVSTVAVCAVACVLAAEFAGGLRERRPSSLLWLLIAAVTFCVAVALTRGRAPAADLQRWIAIGAPLTAAAVCLWFARAHGVRRQPLGSVVSGVLALSLGSLAVFGLGGTPSPDATVSAAETDTSRNIDDQVTRLGSRRRALELRLTRDIPQFRRKLREDASTARNELQTAGAANRERLREELREVAKLMLAVDREESDARELTTRIGQEIRRLERLRTSRQVLADDTALVAELDAIWQRAGQQLSQPIDDRLGTGAIADAEIEAKLDELIRP